MITLINNKFYEKKDAKINVHSSGFMRGYGVFETLRTHGNKKFYYLDDHLERLFRSAKKIHLEIRYSKLDIIKMLNKVVKKSKFKIQRIKIVCVEEGVIITSTKAKINEEIYKGVKVMSIEKMRSLPEIKSLSYLSSYISHEEAVKNGFFEGILIDDKEEVYEGAYSNLFWFEGNTLCTREKDVLPGITRKAVIELSPYKIKYKKINLRKLQKKDEIFITQSVNGIIPVIKINKTKIGNGRVGKRTNEIMELYKAACISNNS